MSSDRETRSTKIHRDKAAIKRQIEIARAHNFPLGPYHRYAKISATTCGDSNCVMCGNPRKFWGEPTIQEKSFDQTAKWDEDVDI